MLTAARSLYKASAAKALPPVAALSALTRNGVCMRAGELVMVAGIPNSGKSAFILWYIKELNLPTLCFSADNSVHTTLTRLLSTITQVNTDSIAEDLEDEDTGTQMADHYGSVLSDSPLQFCFDGTLSLGDITQELDAYIEVYDQWPQVIVIDNLINVDDAVGHEGQNGILSELHYLARMTGSTVFVLHHASESNGQNPTKAPPRAAIQNKVTHYPDLVLSVAADSQTGDFQVAAIKVRGGKSDPLAHRPYGLWADLGKCTFYPENPSPMRDWSPSGWANDEDDE